MIRMNPSDSPFVGYEARDLGDNPADRCLGHGMDVANLPHKTSCSESVYNIQTNERKYKLLASFFLHDHIMSHF